MESKPVADNMLIWSSSSGRGTLDDAPDAMLCGGRTKIDPFNTLMTRVFIIVSSVWVTLIFRSMNARNLLWSNAAPRLPRPPPPCTGWKRPHRTMEWAFALAQPLGGPAATACQIHLARRPPSGPSGLASPPLVPHPARRPAAAAPGLGSPPPDGPWPPRHTLGPAQRTDRAAGHVCRHHGPLCRTSRRARHPSVPPPDSRHQNAVDCRSLGNHHRPVAPLVGVGNGVWIAKGCRPALGGAVPRDRRPTLPFDLRGRRGTRTACVPGPNCSGRSARGSWG